MTVGNAEARRAQVRHAQIQHRQRKANYTKELEMNIVRLRGDIERCNADCWALAGENQGVRQQLVAAAPGDNHPAMPEIDSMTIATHPGDDGVSNSLPPPPQDYGGGTIAAAAAATCVPLSSFDFEPSYMAYLDVDGNRGSPVFQVIRVTTSDHESSASFAEAPRTAGLPSGEDGDRGKPAEEGSGGETDKAINFILA